MFEAIVTLVMTETHDGQTYPVTEVYRLEWDTEEAMRAWLDTSNHDGLLADQQMGSERVDHGTYSLKK